MDAFWKYVVRPPVLVLASLWDALQRPVRVWVRRPRMRKPGSQRPNSPSSKPRQADQSDQDSRTWSR